MVSLLAPLVLLASIEVEGSSDCPTPAEVGQRLQALAPPGADARATVDRQQGRLQARLYRASGALVAERVIDGGGTCADLAAVTAVALAAWAAELAPERVAPPRLQVAAPAPPPEPLLLDVGVGGMASFASGGQVAAGRIESYLGRRGRSWGVQAAFSAGQSRGVQLSAGRASWRQLVAELGPSLRWQRWSLLVDLHAGLAASFLSASAAGYSASREGPAVAAGIRLLRPFGPLAPWVGVSFTQPIFAQRVTTSQGSDSLAFYELQLGGGIAVGRFR